MIKLLFAFVIVLASCSSQKYIVFEHIGESNKPIWCMIIVKEEKLDKKPCESLGAEIVAGKDFELIEKYVIINNTKQKVGKEGYFGTFRISYGKKTDYIVEGRQNAVVYFSNLANLLNSGNSTAIAELIEKRILSRIRYRSDKIN